MQAPIYPQRSGYCQETDTNMVQQCCISHKLLFNRAALHAEEAAEQNWLQCRCIGPTPGVYHKADLTLSLRPGICCTTHPASRPGKQWQSTDCTAAVNPTRSRLTHSKQQRSGTAVAASPRNMPASRKTASQKKLLTPGAGSLCRAQDKAAVCQQYAHQRLICSLQQLLYVG
jgi:hypothetical protein